MDREAPGLVSVSETQDSQRVKKQEKILGVFVKTYDVSSEYGNSMKDNISASSSGWRHKISF